jgi:hypothetical protein
MPIEVALVAIAGMGTFLAMLWFSNRAQADRLRLKHGGGENAARLEKIVAGQAEEMVRLKQRVQVLERLATDDDRRLAGDIERLRTERGPGGV